MSDAQPEITYTYSLWVNVERAILEDGDAVDWDEWTMPVSLATYPDEQTAQKAVDTLELLVYLLDLSTKSP